MKKITKGILGVVATMVMVSGMAMAETQFTPLNFDNNSAPVKTTTESNGTVMLDPSQITGGSKMQSAILQLDNAQVEVRNQLLDYRTNYAQIDSKFQTTKAERKAAKKRIKQAEKKIKNLEKAKVKIRKNFEQKNNVI